MDEDDEDGSGFTFMPMHPEGAPGQLQIMLGDAGMQAYLENQETEAAARNNLMLAEIDRRDTVSALINSVSKFVDMIPFFVFLVLVPIVYALWKWAV